MNKMSIINVLTLGALAFFASLIIGVGDDFLGAALPTILLAVFGYAHQYYYDNEFLDENGNKITGDEKLALTGILVILVFVYLVFASFFKGIDDIVGGLLFAAVILITRFLPKK